MTSCLFEITVLAFNANFAAIDINVKRILIHFKFINEFAKDLEIQNIANLLVPYDNSRDWHNALMDFSSVKLKQIKVSSVIVKPFKGSTRETRGKIIKLLTRFDPLSLEEINEELKIRSSDLKNVLENLVQDELIVKMGKQFRI